MRILVSIDDTDDLHSAGTGEIAETLARELTELGYGNTGRVTRHQLLIHPDIAYTSHNSAMCFDATVSPERMGELIEMLAARLTELSVEAADPGLAVVDVDATDTQALMEYGRQAKVRVFTKQEAYDTARRLGVHLSEHGGTGIGVIGALAGAGLRLTGHDGRFKGKFRLSGDEDGVATVAQILHQDVDHVRTLDGVELDGDQVVDVSTPAKLVLLDGAAVLMVEPSPDGVAAWRLVDRKALRTF